MEDSPPPPPPPPSRCRTRATNVNKHPGDIVKPSKRRTKAEKAVDDKRLKDAEAAKAQAAKDSIQRLALMEIDADMKVAEAKANKLRAVRPRPRPRVRAPHGTSSGTVAPAAMRAKGDVSMGSSGMKTLTEAVGKASMPSSPEPEAMVIAVTQAPMSSTSLKQSIKDWKIQHGNKAIDADVRWERSSKKFALGGQVKNWAANVAKASRAPDSHDAKHSATNSSTLVTTPCSTIPAFPATSTSSLELSSSALSLVPPHAPDFDMEIFADAVDDTEEKIATIKGTKAGSTGVKEMVAIIQPAESDEDVSGPLMPVGTHVTSYSFKRKANEAEVVSDSEPDDEPDDNSDMKLTPAPADLDGAPKMVKPTPKKGKGHRTTASTSVGVTVNTHLSWQKKIKLEEPIPTIAAHPPGSSVDDSASVSTSNPQALDNVRRGADGYIIETIKKRCDYSNKDLPVASDHRWSRGVIATVTLWCGIQDNVWSIPEDKLTAALQVIIDVVYPGLKYRVTPAGSVFGVAIQRISEWHGGFGSTALAMMVDFFSRFDDNVDIRTAAVALHKDYRFLQEDPDEPSADRCYRSGFLLELIASMHLSNIVGFVDILGWDTQKVSRGEGQEGVIAIAAAALERAVQFIMDGTIDIEQILQAMAETSDPKPKIKLPKVLNKATGRETSAPYQFSASNWGGNTAGYKDSILNRGSAFVRATVASAQLLKNVGTSNNTSDGRNDASESSVNPQALLYDAICIVQSLMTLFELFTPDESDN
ncbi:hypothetical protein BU15DRAFT_65319 [Melanogaster broomeanus]|nr:hypothetical protein BU15DRAFT_65319 [Melanogaster broomeanus]